MTKSKLNTGKTKMKAKIKSKPAAVEDGPVELPTYSQGPSEDSSPMPLTDDIPTPASSVGKGLKEYTLP